MDPAGDTRGDGLLEFPECLQRHNLPARRIDPAIIPHPFDIAAANHPASILSSRYSVRIKMYSGPAAHPRPLPGFCRALSTAWTNRSKVYGFSKVIRDIQLEPFQSIFVIGRADDDLASDLHRFQQPEA